MTNPFADLSDKELQEILERSHGSQGQKVLIQEEQKARLAERITELEALNAKQSERISELDRLLGRTEESSAEQYERAKKAEAENVKLREKCDAAFTGLLGASRGECIAWGRRERQPEIDKLREAAEELVEGANYRGCTPYAGLDASIKKLKAALAKGDKK